MLSKNINGRSCTSTSAPLYSVRLVSMVGGGRIDRLDRVDEDEVRDVPSSTPYREGQHLLRLLRYLSVSLSLQDRDRDRNRIDFLPSKNHS